MKDSPPTHRRSIRSADAKVEPSSCANSFVSPTIDPSGDMFGIRKRSNSNDTASLSSFSSEEFSPQSSAVQLFSQAVSETALGENNHQYPPSRRCHPIAFEIDGISLKNHANERQRRPSLWQQLYDNLSSEILDVEGNDAVEGCPSASFNFSLSRASDGDTRASTERHPIGLADILMDDTVDDVDDSDTGIIFTTPRQPVAASKRQKRVSFA